jgi:light-regulated signal transduction histidine kinase (bacteriophytochrome)
MADVMLTTDPLPESRSWGSAAFVKANAVLTLKWNAPSNAFTSVSANGIGIEPQYVDRVFTIFQRLHARDVYTGTGIGLAVCRKIVDYHGGNIWIDTTWTEGARVCFTLVGAKTQTELGPSGAVHPADLPGAARS